jgi:hypothetical protein
LPKSSSSSGTSTNAAIHFSGGPVAGTSLTRTKESEPALTTIDSPNQKPEVPTQTLSTADSPDRFLEPIQTEAVHPRSGAVAVHPSGGAASHATGSISATTATQTGRHTTQPSISTKSDAGSDERHPSESAAHPAVIPAETLPHPNRLSETPQGTAVRHGLDVAQTTSSTTSPPGLHGQISPGEKSTGAPSPPGAAASREPFAAIDAEFVQARPTWIHAGANHAEAGYQDADLGWVGVRAEVSGGGIHAALVPGSTEAAQALSGHMTGLNAYLTDHHAGVEKLTLTAPQGQSAFPGLEQGSSQNMQQGTGQNSRQGQGAEQYWMNRTEAPPVSLAAGSEARAQDAVPDVSSYALPTEGNHISVLA